jgi:16S rRNA processing protein RimM
VTDSTSWTSVARLVRPQGRRGEILAEILTDFPERFAAMHEAFLRRQTDQSPTPISLEEAWLHKGRVVLKFAGINSITEADTLRGAELVIPAADRMQLEEDAAYIGDMKGCQLIDLAQPNHPLIGIVEDVIQQENTTDLLVVRGPDDTEHWIPFAKAYLVRLDLAGRRVEMNLPAGLLEVNAPLNEEERRQAEIANTNEPENFSD